jgi:Fe-S-cluster containining protein
MVYLSRQYVSLLGSTKAFRVSEELFTTPFDWNCMEKSCAACCHNGVWVELATVVKILKVKALDDYAVRVPRKKWFDRYVIYDDFQQGLFLPTRKVNGCCSFFNNDPNLFGCSIQRYSDWKGLDIHTLKPMMCLLFPIDCTNGLLSAKLKIPGITVFPCSDARMGSTVYRVLRGELQYYFGSALVQELDAIELLIYKSRKEEVHV